MTDFESKIESLDRLLEEAAESPTVVAILERAEDSGHLDDDWIMALAEGSATEEEERRARRHVVFCDRCADLLLNRGGEVAKGEGLPKLGEAPKEAEKRPQRISPETAKRLLAGLVVVVVLSTFVFVALPMLLKSDIPDTVAGEEGQALFVGGRGASDSEKGRLSLSRLAYLQVRGNELLAEEYVYLFLVGAGGELLRFEPKRGPAQSFDMSTTFELPNDFGGYDLRQFGIFAAGQRIGFFLFNNKERISVLEGEVFERVTGPLIIRDAIGDRKNLDEAGYRALAGRMRKLNLPGQLIMTSVRLVP